MRIIGGKAKGRRLRTPSKSTAKYFDQHIRPTADRAREALFNILGRIVANATVLDLYAGTGALGLEALSRSAEQAVFVDKSPQAIQIIKQNIALCGFSDKTIVLKRDLEKGLNFVTKQLPGLAFSLVFVDPPYRKGLSAAMLHELAESNILLPESLIIIEDDAFTELPAQVAELCRVDYRRYSETGFWFYRQKEFLQEFL